MKRKILLVDDEPNILKALGRLLRRSGYEVFTATSAAEGILLQQQQLCPLIISDFRMPEQNGAAFLSQVQLFSPDTVSMILSAYTDFASLLAIINSGVAFKFLQKPWTEADLLCDIEQAWQLYLEKQQEKLITELLIGSQDALVELDSIGQILRLNAAAGGLLGAASHELIGSNLTLRIAGLSVEHLHSLLTQHQLSYRFNTSANNEIELIYQCHSENCILLRLVQSRLPSPFYPAPGARNLLNRDQLLAAIQQNLASQQPSFAVVYLDIVNFDDMHQSMGFDLIDQLLVQLCQRLPGVFGDSNMVASLYADQFAVLLQNVAYEAKVLQQMEHLSKAFLEPIELANSAIRVRFRIGYSLAPNDGCNAQLLLDHARQAAASCGNNPGSVAQRFDQRYINDRRRQYEISNALYNPLVCQDFSVHFQPKVRLYDGKIDGAEILLRWHHAELGSISPAMFIPIAERDGQIHKIGHWVLKQSLQQLERWQLAGHSTIRLSVNVSAAQLMHPEFVSNVRQMLHQYPIPADSLEFELTETLALNDLNRCSSLMSQLKTLGIQLAIDDFGSGYASLAYLNQLPVDVVKLDRSLLVDLETSLSCQSMVRNMIRMIRELNISVVAEGIENETQVAILRQMQCDYVQGFVFSKPVPVERCVELLHSQPFTENWLSQGQ